MGTIEYIDGFDEYLGSQAMAHGWSRAPTSTLAGRVDGFAVQHYGTPAFNRSVTPDSRYTVDVAWKCANINVAFDIVNFYEGTTLHGKVRMNVDNTLSVVGGPSGTTVLGTSATFGFTANIWYHLGFDYSVNDSTGAFEVRLNDVNILADDTIDTRNGGTGVINVVNVAPLANQYVSYDDLVITKGGGFQGDCRVITSTATAAGSNSDWTPTSPPSLAFQVCGTATNGSAGMTFSWPTHQIDDIGLLIIETCGGEPVVITTGDGWLEVPGSPQATGLLTAGTRLTVYWCRASSSAMPDVIASDPGDHWSGLIATFRGCAKSISPIDASGGGVKASASGSATITGVTTTVANALIVQIITNDLDAAAAWASGQTNANLTGITEQYDWGTTQGNGGGISFITATKTTAGATGDTTVTVTSSINAFMTIALTSAGTANYASANDEFPNNDLDYISSSTVDQRDTYSFPDLGTTGTIKAVAINHVSRKDDAGDRKVVTVIRDGSTNYDNATAQTLSTTYAGQQQIYEEDPSTTDPWTVSNLDAREYGIGLDT